MKDHNEGSGRFAGLHVLFTGGSSGIGRACVEILLGAGASVTLLDLQPPSISYASLRFIETDVGDPTAVHDAVVASGPGPIDRIVNCAGFPTSSGLEDTDLETWAKAIAVNLTAPYLICREALSRLRQGRALAIVNVASGVALRPSVGGFAYTASKGGLLAMTRQLALELSPGIRVNAVCPGLTDTPMVANNPATHASLRGEIVRGYAMQRMAQPEEVAQAIVFLLSDEASYITGATLAADGGRTFH